MSNTEPEYYVSKLAEKEGKELKIQECILLGGESGGNTAAKLFKVLINDDGNLRKLVLKTVDTSKVEFSPALRDKFIERFLMCWFGFTDAQMLQLEINFYSVLKPLFDAEGEKLQLFPQIFIAKFFPDQSLLSKTRYIVMKRKQHTSGAVLMEDLSVRGQFFPATSTNIDINILKALTVTAATFTGLSVKVLKNFRGKVQKSFQYPLTIMNVGLVATIKRFGFGRGTTKHVARLWGSSYFKCLVDDHELVTALEALESSYSTLSKISHRVPFQCIVHGDLHAQNAAYFPEAKSIKLFDMQMYGIGSPAIELAYFLASNFNPADEATERSIIELYHTTLISVGEITNYPLKSFLLHVRVAQIEFAVAALVRRAKIDNPRTVAKAFKKNKKFENQIKSLQQVMLDRELRLLEKIKMIYRTNPTFQKDKLSAFE